MLVAHFIFGPHPPPRSSTTIGARDDPFVYRVFMDASLWHMGPIKPPVDKKRRKASPSLPAVLVSVPQPAPLPALPSSLPSSLQHMHLSADDLPSSISHLDMAILEAKFQAIMASLFDSLPRGAPVDARITAFGAALSHCSLAELLVLGTTPV